MLINKIKGNIAKCTFWLCPIPWVDVALVIKMVAYSFIFWVNVYVFNNDGIFLNVSVGYNCKRRRDLRVFPSVYLVVSSYYR